MIAAVAMLSGHSDRSIQINWLRKLFHLFGSRALNSGRRNRQRIAASRRLSVTATAIDWLTTGEDMRGAITTKIEAPQRAAVA